MLAEYAHYSTEDGIKAIALGQGVDHDWIRGQKAVLFRVVKLNLEARERSGCPQQLKTLANSFLVLAKLFVKQKSCFDLPVFLHNREAVIDRIE